MAPQVSLSENDLLNKTVVFIGKIVSTKKANGRERKK